MLASYMTGARPMGELQHSRHHALSTACLLPWENCVAIRGTVYYDFRMTGSTDRWRRGLLAGVKRGGRSFLWICKIVIPVSLLTAVLQWTGWLDQLSFLFAPLMGFINLPPQAALPIISAMLTNLYVAIAAMTALPFTVEQMTLIAIFTLICHNLITEGIVQHRSGMNVVKITTIRFAAAVLTVFIVSQFFGDTGAAVEVPAQLTHDTPLLAAIRDWGIDLLVLLLRILGIVMTIMIMLDLSESLGWTERLIRACRPLMRVLGLSKQSASLWVTSAVFGLMYGGAVTVDRARKGNLSKQELERLHISIGINHGLVEDPALFLAFALNPLWLWGPKLATAIVAVQLYRVVQHLRSRLQS